MAGEKALISDNQQKFGESLPDFTLVSTNGNHVGLSAGMVGRKGGVVLFWSGICSHCVRYDGYLNAFAEKNRDVALFVVASRHGETEAQIQKAIADRGLTFPILLDPGGTVAAKYMTQQTPRAYLLDPELKLVYRGAIDNYKYTDDPEHLHYLDPAIHQFLTGVPLMRPETASFGCAIQSVYYILPKAL